MKYLLVVVAFAASAAQADLYRWVDPQSGSVKYSSIPPAWYGDPERERRSPAVEVVPFRRSGVPAASNEHTTLAGLEARWKSLLQAFAELAASGDFKRAGRGMEKELQAYQALLAQLDREDPGGAARRRAEEAAVMEKLQKDLKE